MNTGTGMLLEFIIECDICHRESEEAVQLPDGTYICPECMDDRRI